MSVFSAQGELITTPWMNKCHMLHVFVRTQCFQDIRNRGGARGHQINKLDDLASYDTCACYSSCVMFLGLELLSLLIVVLCL